MGARAGNARSTALGLVVLLFVAGAAGKQDEREKRRDIVDMAFCGDDDCYAILNITADSTRGEVKRGYHKMSLLYHPDKLGDKSDEDKAAGNAMFIKVSEAYGVLSDEESRRKYDLWVRSGRKRRPAPGDDMGPMPAHYRDDSVRDVQDTPLAFAGVAVTILISIGLPICLQMQGKSKKAPRRPPKDKNADTVQVAHVPRKERRGEREAREARDPASHFAPQAWAPESWARKKLGRSAAPVAELIKAVAKLPGGTVDRWSKIAEFVGSRTAEDCMARAALLKGKATASMGGGPGAGGGAGNRTGGAGAKNEMRSAYNAPAGGAGPAAGAGGGGTAREDLVKMSVTEFAKLVKEKEREKLEREKQRDRITNAVASKEDAAKSVKPQHVETVKKKTGSKPKIAPLSTQAAQQDDDEWAAAFQGDDGDDGGEKPTPPPLPPKDRKEKPKPKEDAAREDQDAAVAGGGWQASSGENASATSAARPWTAAEQTLLENAMRSVDKTLEDRWDRIADLIPNRSRKEVVSRVKDVKKMLASSLA